MQSQAMGLNYSLTYPTHNFVSPFSNSMEVMTRNWIDDYQCLDPEFRVKAKKANYGILTAEIIPLAQMETLIPIARWMLWAFVWDDYYGPCKKEDLKRVCKKAISILSGHPCEKEDNDLFQQLAVIRDELLQTSSSEWMNRFIRSHKYYFSGLLMDVYSYRKDIQYPSPEEYLKIRDRLIGGHMVCDLLELACNQPFPEEIFLHPAIQRLRLIATRLMIWDNDIFSYQKELQEGEAMNYVLVLHAKNNLTIERAVDFTINIRNEYYAELINFQSIITDFGHYQEMVMEYWQNIVILLRGQLDWYLAKSNRYK